MNPLQPFDESTIVECFNHIHNPSSTPAVRKQADTFLIECEKQIVPLLKILMQIFINFDNKYNQQIRLQSLIYLSNVIKRNWNNKRLLKTQQELPQLRKAISAQLVTLLQKSERVFIKSLYDIIAFIAKSDYPHAFGELTLETLNQISNIQVNEENVRNFKALRDIFLQLSDRKGFSNAKNFEEGPLKILATLGPVTEGLRAQICKIENLNVNMVKLSKYCDQIMISLMRIAPYSYLDDENFMLLIRHISQKLQTLLTAHNSQSPQNRGLLQKDIKSIIYQLGCLQTANPCIMAPILSDYISTLFYVTSKPELFQKPATIKYCLLSLRKVIKEFTYYSQNQAFEKSIASQPKSCNYLQLRNVASQSYKEALTEETVEGLFTFLLTSIMSIRSKEDEGLVFGFDDATGYEKSAQKQLSVHLCGTLVVESLIERFPEKMLSIIYNSLKTCIDNNWGNIDNSTLLNFISIISILPKSCKKSMSSYLTEFPIISILQFVHGAQNNKIKEKFPALISGWLDIFTNDQLAQLIEALLNYITEGSQLSSMEILLYSCYSLNKIVSLRTSAVDCGYVLHRVFPVAIKVFNRTDNPEILWPLITLISTLLTKCQFDTSLIVHSVEQNSLSSLISNQSAMLVQALCQMFKSFLCIIPRNKPAIAVFKLICHFLNIHLANTQAEYHEKCVQLWYYSVRQFSGVNQCNEEYNDLFQNHFRRCMFNMKPILIYILEEYLLLGLIQSKLDAFTTTVIEFYREGEFLEYSDQINQNSGSREESINLKIAALSFQITLITKYNIEQVNSEQILYAIVKDFCNSGSNENKNYGNKIISNTLQNSLLSIINRYIMLYPDYFFNFLLTKLDITPSVFYLYYFKSMEFLTSRTAIKINALALVSLLPRIHDQFRNQNNTHTWPCIIRILKFVIPEVENSQAGQSAPKVENSPTIRFSQSILSERKEQIRKQGSYDNIDLRQYFLTQFKQTIEKAGVNLGGVAEMMEQDEAGKNWGHRLLSACQ